jgi:hypothetical protein
MSVSILKNRLISTEKVKSILPNLYIINLKAKTTDSIFYICNRCFSLLYESIPGREHFIHTESKYCVASFLSTGKFQLTKPIPKDLAETFSALINEYLTQYNLAHQVTQITSEIKSI